MRYTYDQVYEIACAEFMTDEPTDEQIEEMYEDLQNPPEYITSRDMHER